jgi:hypothetical protein
MYIATYTHHTGLLGMASSWSSSAVNVVEGQCTLVLTQDSSCVALTNPPPPTLRLWHHPRPTARHSLP